MSEIQLTQRNLQERGVTPPPEEKVAYYVYQQSKVQVDRPESNHGTEILKGYASEPVAWAPEVPLDWHSQEFMPGQPGHGLPTRNNSSGNIASNSYPSMSRLGLTGQPNPRASIDRDFMDLEAEIMDLGGTEVNYDFQKGNIPDIDIASDIQEQSVGEKSPNFRTAPLADTVDTFKSPAVSARRISQRDNAGTPSRGGKVPLAVPTIRGESVAANTPKTTAIQINIQPPTDSSISRVPSMALQDSPTRRSGGVSGTAKPQSPRPASPSPLRNTAASPPGAARPSPLSQQVHEPQPPLPSTPGTPATPAKAPPPVVVPAPIESPPAVQTETAPATAPVEKPTKKGKMAKKKGGKATLAAKKAAAKAREEEDVPPVPELPTPATPAAKSPTTPAMGVQVTNKFSPNGYIESVTVSAPVPQAAMPTPSPSLSRALELQQMTPQAPAREIPSRAPSRANVRSPRIPSRSVTPAPNGGHTPRDSFDFHAPLPGSTTAPVVPLPDPHSTDYAMSSMSPGRRSQMGRPEEGTVTVRGPGRSRAESRATEMRSPTVKGGTLRNEPLDPRLNGGDTAGLQKFLDGGNLTPKAPSKNLGSRVPSEHPQSPSRASERARYLADDGFGADGRRQEEYVSVPASQFRPSSRASNTPTTTPYLVNGQPSLTDMWNRFQGGEPVAPELDHHEPPPASPLSSHSRAGSRLLDAPGRARSKQGSVTASPAQTPSHFRQPAAARDSILSRLDELPDSVPKSPAVRSHGIREPSVREPSIREPSIREPSIRESSIREPSIREPSIREPSIREPSIRAVSPPPEHTPPPPRGYTPQPATPASPAPSFPIPEHMKNPTSPRRRAPPSDITYTDPRRDSRISLPSPAQAAFPQSRTRGPENGRREKSVSQELAALERMEEEDDDSDGPATGRRSPAMPERERMSAREAMEVLKTPGTSYSITPSALAAEVNKSHFHDEDLCVLLHAADDSAMPDVVRKAVRKAVRSRVKKLGLENEDQYRVQHMGNKGKHKHRISYAEGSAKAPEWARPLFQLLEQAQERLDSLDSKLEASRPNTQNSLQHRHPYDDEHDDDDYLDDDYEPGTEINRTPRTPHQRIASQEMDMQHTGASSNFRRGDRRRYEAEDDMDYDDAPHGAPSRESGIEEELYRLKMKNPADYDDSVHSEAPIPEIPGSEAQYFDDGRDAATPTPRRAAGDVPGETSQEVTPHSNGPAFVRPREHWTGGSAPNWGAPNAPAWQLVHQRLLNWTIVWSMSELDRALESTERGRQVDECSLTVWTMQCYKRYVRVRTTDHPPKKVDRLFVPPNVADAINSAVYNGRHADATVMLKDLWTPFGFDEMPRLILVLARHRRDNNHWVVHRFSIPEGTLCTYDTYPEKALADGRPLGWWFAIRAAWPHAMYPNPDHLVQKLVRIHRPLQLLIDNSVAATAIWRNLLMGSKAERSVDLVRMRDLVHTEVRAMKLRKEQGKLALPASRTSWDHQITES